MDGAAIDDGVADRVAAVERTRHADCGGEGAVVRGVHVFIALPQGDDGIRRAAEATRGGDHGGHDRLNVGRRRGVTRRISALAVCCLSDSRSSVNSRRFWMAITAWSAKTLRISMWLSVNRSTWRRVSTMTRIVASL